MNLTNFLNNIQRQGDQLNPVKIIELLQAITFNNSIKKEIFTELENEHSRNLFVNTEFYTIEGITIPAFSQTPVFKCNNSKAMIFHSCESDAYVIEHKFQPTPNAFTTLNYGIYPIVKDQNVTIEHMTQFNLWNKTEETSKVLILNIKTNIGKEEQVNHKIKYQSINQIELNQAI